MRALNVSYKWLGLFLMAALVSIGNTATAEQKKSFGPYEVHYIIFPTTDLKAEIANKYGITRSDKTALVNVSVIDSRISDNNIVNAVSVDINGRSSNLLGQRQELDFAKHGEGSAIYYLASLRHADEEVHRVELDVTLPNGRVAEIRFQQKMYWKR